jgi:hypothetical protein
MLKYIEKLKKNKTEKNKIKKNKTEKNKIKKNKTKKNKKEKNKTKKIKNVYKKITRQVIPKLSKQEITKILYPISKEDAINDYNKLKNINCDDISTTQLVGSDFVNYYTSIERLNTKGRLNISFFDVCKNFNKYYNEKYYFRNGINSAFKRGEFLKLKDNKKIFRNLKSFYNLYLGNVGIFRPIIAKHVICKYKPKHVLDFTMGWGGRLVAACSENVESYIGIDLNSHLKPLYEKMVNQLKKLSTTKIKLYFKDALKIDYSKINYDFVLTSPPYYNVEIYRNNDILEKEEWNDKFYIPLFTKTYKYLKKNGYYCLNVPTYIYDEICIKIIGESDEKIPLGKPKRLLNDEYSEYIYIWHKK